MNTKRFGRTLAATLSGPLVAAGIVLGSMVIGDSATASAQPTSDGQCASMPMTEGQNQNGPSALTRAGQVGAASGPTASDGSMAVNCQPASHG
jgi:hypothetical protein